MNSDFVHKITARSESLLLLRLQAQQEGVAAAAAATYATNLLLQDAIDGRFASQDFVIYEDENPPAMPVDSKPWVVASVSAPRRWQPLNLKPSPLLYVTEKEYVEEEPLGVYREKFVDGAISYTRQSPLKAFIPRLKIKAWNLEALALGVIRESYANQISVHENFTSSLVDISHLDAPDSVRVPESPREWSFLFQKVHAQYAPEISVSLALPAAIIRGGVKRTFAQIVTLSAMKVWQPTEKKENVYE